MIKSVECDMGQTVRPYVCEVVRSQLRETENDVCAGRSGAYAMIRRWLSSWKGRAWRGLALAPHRAHSYRKDTMPQGDKAKYTDKQKRMKKGWATRRRET